MTGPGLIDCHCHVIDPARFAYQTDTRYRPVGQEIAPLDHLLRIMDQHDVSHALIVGTNSGYGVDSRPVLDALARGEGRFRGVAVVENDISTAELARLKAAGMVGIAFNTAYHGTEYYAQSQDLLRRLADLGMFLQVQYRDEQLLDLLPLIQSSDVALVVDHCGRPAPSLGLEQAGFQALLALGRAGRASVKLSGFSQFSADRYPYADTQPYIEALLAAFTPDRCVWGSDWPFLRAPERIDYGPLIAFIRSLLVEDAVFKTVMSTTPARLFGFAV
jgi:predicted TIM-barrel fold metal-dependent hydrolase